MTGLPLTLGICRECALCSPRRVMTLDMAESGTIYYCNAKMHGTDGRDRCADFRQRPDAGVVG